MRPDVAAAPRPRTRRSIGPTIATVVAGLVVLGLALGPLSALFESPSFVPRITFVNTSEYDLSIDATDDKGDGWMSVGTAQKESTTVHEEIIDQGEVWIFRFRGQGQDAGELRFTRQQLDAEKWTVRIPETIAEALRAKGAPPTP